MTSTLALPKSAYEAEVGDFLGYGRGTPGTNGVLTWDATDLAHIQMDVASALRRFYWCGHPWSFLQPVYTAILETGANTVTLPEEFGGVEGGTSALVMDSSNTRIGVLSFTGAPLVEQSYLDNTSQGPPMRIAHRPIKKMQAGRLQREELLVFPLADQVYQIVFHYFITPDFLTDVTQPYAYGGVDHHETILELCLAVAEMRRDNAALVHGPESLRLLELSQLIDKRKKPVRLGYNGDRSDSRIDHHWFDNWGGHGRTIQDGVYFNGTLYD